MCQGDKVQHAGLVQVINHRPALACACDHAGLFQDLKVLAHQWLRLGDSLHHLANGAVAVGKQKINCMRKGDDIAERRTEAGLTESPREE